MNCLFGKVGLCLLSTTAAFIFWQALDYALAISGVPILMRIAAVISYWVIYGWIFFIWLAAFFYYLLWHHFPQSNVYSSVTPTFRVAGYLMSGNKGVRKHFA